MKRNTVLVVDDEEMVREVIGDILVTDFNVFEASNGIEALEILGKNLSPQLIITDYNMPKMDGREFIKSLREIKNETPVICLTGRGSSNLHLDMWMKGVYEYVEKPFEPESFLRKALNAVELGANLLQESKFRRLSHHSSIQISIEINKGLHEDIISYAQQRGLSVSSLIEEVLAEKMQAHKKGA